MSKPGFAGQFIAGARASAPFVIIVGPFALLFGVVATEAGLPLAQVMGFSFLVIAGAAQFTALQLMVEQAPTVVVLASALAVNLRMAMYSASLAPHIGAAPLWKRAVLAYFLVDQSYAVAINRFERPPEMTLAHKLAFFAGSIAPVAPVWYLFSYIGAVAGGTIPPEYALDFAVPVTFLAIIAPALRTLAHVAAALVAVVLGLALTWVPYNLGLPVAALAAMMAGAEVERRGYWSPPK